MIKIYCNFTAILRFSQYEHSTENKCKSQAKPNELSRHKRKNTSNNSQNEITNEDCHLNKTQYVPARAGR